MRVANRSVRRWARGLAGVIVVATVMVSCGQASDPLGTEVPSGSPTKEAKAAATAEGTPSLASPLPTSTTEPSDTPVELPDAPQLDPQQTSQVLESGSALCQGGGGIPGTAGYDPAAPGPHPVLVLDGNHDSGYTWFAWTPVPEPGNGVAHLDQYAYAQLVACIDAREGLELARVCDVVGSDGSVDPGRSVEIYNAANYHVSVYAAATGELVAETSLTQSEPEGCPLSVIFSGDQTVVTLYASPSEDSLRAILEPLIQP
jgi:hypothetical protein